MNQRKIIHIDMDCFYAAVEIRDNPHLTKKAVAVGGDAYRRGVLCTSNYIAREFGVRAAMPTAQAYRLCPDLVVIKPNFSKYKAVSEQIRQIFSNYTELIEPLSLDEAYLDVSDSSQCQGSASWIAQEIRQSILNDTGLTASAGVAPNKFLAKIASDWQKPNGLTVIRPEQVQSFVTQLPVEKIFGVGKVTAEKLHRLGIKTCGDIQIFTKEKLHHHFGKFGEHLFELSNGNDKREVKPDRIRKSLSVEETFSFDLNTLSDCMKRLPSLLEELTHRLDKKDLSSTVRKLFVKIKFHDFTSTTVECIASEPQLETFQHLFREGYARKELPVRLLGLGVRFADTESTQAKQLGLVL